MKFLHAIPLTMMTILFCSTVSGQEPPSVFRPVPIVETQRATSAEILGSTGIRARLVTIDRGAIPGPQQVQLFAESGATREIEVRLNLLPRSEFGSIVRRSGVGRRSRELVLTAVLEAVDRPPTGPVTWLGRIKDDPDSSVSITSHEDVVLITVRSTRYGVFEVTPLPTNTNISIVREVDDRLIRECGVGELAPPQSNEEREVAAQPEDEDVTPDPSTRIDVLGLYTPEARREAGGKTAIEALIYNSVARGNRALTKSLIATQFAVVHVREVTGYTEVSGRNGFYTMLDDLEYVDGELDEVHEWRNTHKADLVFMIVDNDAIGGLANTMPTRSPNFARAAYSVTSRRYALSWITAAHEMAHNMGSCHHPNDGERPCNGSYSYSYGHRFTGTDRKRYRTVMAYQPGTRIERFSNPAVKFRGRRTGQAGKRNNAASLNNTASVVANFRRSIR